MKFSAMMVFSGLWLLQLFGRWPGAISRGMRQMMDQAEPYTPTVHDVIVGSYFKSGTNWRNNFV